MQSIAPHRLELRPARHEVHVAARAHQRRAEERADTAGAVDQDARRVHLRGFAVGVGLGGGAGLYSSITLLITAIGRPGAMKLSLPSIRTTESFSPTMLMLCSSSGISRVIVSSPVGATALSPPGPLPPPTRSNRSPALRNSLCTTARDSSVLSAVMAPTVAVYFE